LRAAVADLGLLQAHEQERVHGGSVAADGDGEIEEDPLRSTIRVTPG
jgi:hypothetical protein